MKYIWVRVGMTYEVTDEHYKVLEDAINQNDFELVREILCSSRHYENGERYLPANADNNPNFTEDFDF